MEDRGKINEYTCEKGHKIVTINTDEGTTPLTIKCRHRMCNRIATSELYLVDQTQEPTHEWYRPNNLEELSDWDLHHIELGGLLLRKLKSSWRPLSKLRVKLFYT